MKVLTKSYPGLAVIMRILNHNESFPPCYLSMTGHQLSLKQILSLTDSQYRLVDVHPDDSLNDYRNVLLECLEGKDRSRLNDLVEDIYADALNTRVREETDILAERCSKHFGIEREMVNIMFDFIGDYIADSIMEKDMSDPAKELAGNTRPLPATVRMQSNHDCMNSSWSEGQDGFRYADSYFREMIDVLFLNPRTVKNHLDAASVRTFGEYPDLPERNGHEAVTYEEFVNEVLNSPSGANLLTFMGKVNVSELYDKGFDISEVVIPKGNMCGLFSPYMGGGSQMEMELLRDVRLNVCGNATINDTGISFDLSVEGTDGYSIKEVYGVTDDFYGKEFTTVKKNFPDSEELHQQYKEFRKYVTGLICELMSHMNRTSISFDNQDEDDIFVISYNWDGEPVEGRICRIEKNSDKSLTVYAIEKYSNTVIKCDTEYASEAGNVDVLINIYDKIKRR